MLFNDNSDFYGTPNWWFSILLDLVNCDAVDGDPEATFAGEGWVHQERLNLDVNF